ncbi:hypothetical protein DPMN_022546 [Dreissena polymorpha]|uniref:C1q domain-containing protein n=1 Tax=Dreissena polymorpha TaxID=45954 RepID=A0A9D4SBT0_DREPO|nr:hypothetical protein DPMN_022546 [Dreissena polymorpha]
MQLRKKCLFVLLHVIVATCSIEPSSPIRSRFEFEERLLERVLKNELALTTTLNEILKTNAKVVDALKQDEKIKVESSLALMEKQQIKMESRLSDFVKNASNNINSTLDNSLNILKDQLKVPTIYFRAHLTASSTDLSNNQDVVFSKVEVSASVAMGHQVWVRTTMESKFSVHFTGFNLFSGTLIHS